MYVTYKRNDESLNPRPNKSVLRWSLFIYYYNTGCKACILNGENPSVSLASIVV